MTTRILEFNPLLFLLLVIFMFSSCSSDDDAVENRAPNAFNITEPSADATGVEIQPQLSWEAATDPDGDSVTYQVYLDTQNPPQTSIANNLEVSVYNFQSELELQTTYYWMVIAKDSNGNITESEIASFTSRDMTTEEAIVGKWFFQREGGLLLTECEKQSFFQFDESLAIETIEYYSETEDECIASALQNGTYAILANNHIEIFITDGWSDNWEIQSLTETELVFDTGDGYLLELIKE